MKKIFISVFTLLLMSCGASVKSNFTSPQKPLTDEDKVAILDIQNSVPQSAIKIGNAKYGDTGFSIDCDFITNLSNAKILAKSKGANIIKITEKKSPSILGSSCYRIKVDFYLYNGDLSKLSQYQLQTN